ncbi:hypothetical protein [Halomonas mongoliensis]|uniref:hypothetical protein n=1 Tax=Halomonas mongoliensis TaxID=321265 RepID=UPI00403A7F82
MYYLDHGDTNSLREILAFASRRTDKERLNGYAEYLMPIHIYSELGRVRVSRRGDDYKPIEIIDFYSYKKISAVMKVNNSNLAKLRNEINNIYSGGLKRGLERLFKWPTTEAPDALKSLFVDGWVQQGMLQHFDYHVGSGSRNDHSRQQCLRRLMSESFDKTVFSKSYAQSWCEPGSIARLMKLANTIASMCRNAKRSPHNYEKAIEEWERDLDFLRREYYEKLVGWEELVWPSTEM